MNNYFMSTYSKTYRLLLSGLFVLFCLAGAATATQSVSAYSTDYAGAKAWGDDFCRTNPTGLGDYVWLTGTDGTDTVTAKQGDASVTVRVHAAGKYCGFYRSAGAGSIYRSDIGSVNGTFGQYSGNGPNRYFGEDLQDIAMDIRSMSAGTHTICMTLTTFTWAPPLPALPSPSACSTIKLVLIQPWSISGDSKVGVDFTPPNVSTWSAKPGQRLYWRHTLTNNGPGNTGVAIGYAVGRSGFTSNWPGGAAPNNNQPNGSRAMNANTSFTLGWNTPAPRNAYSTYTVQDSDLGNTLCQWVSWGPTSSKNGNWSQSTPSACVSVPYNYNLTPSVTGPNGMGSIGSTIPTVTPKVNNQVAGNAAATTASPPTTEWQLKRVEVGPGKTIPMTQQQNTNDPCTHYKSGGATTCIDKGSGTRAFPAGSTTLALLANEQIGASTPAGTKICFTLSVRPYSQSTGNSWRHGVPVCITVSKQPKIQVWGSDVRTRGGIETGTTVVSSGGSDKLFGSWVEYGGFSVGSNDGFASGSGLNNGNLDTTGASSWNKLTFANVNTAGADSYGRFTLPTLPDLATQFNGAASGGAINANLGTLNSGTYKVGNFTTTGGAIGQTAGKGKTIIIISTGTVTINGDIRYKGNGASDTFTSVAELPQVIIVAKNINITNATKQIDAWLLTTGATGTINTCSDRAVGAALNSTVCNNQLTVNGPVVTEHLYLRRTAGSDSAADAGKPAEVFNLRPDAYLWAQARASQSGKAQTVYSVELPPRF